MQVLSFRGSVVEDALLSNTTATFYSTYSITNVVWECNRQIYRQYITSILYVHFMFYVRGKYEKPAGRKV
jgi:hypothetical protein